MISGLLQNVDRKAAKAFFRTIPYRLWALLARYYCDLQGAYNPAIIASMQLVIAHDDDFKVSIVKTDAG